MHPDLENLINMALADGEITEKEREIIFRKAEKLGEDKDEVEMILDGKIAMMKKEQATSQQQTIKSNKEGDIKKCPSCGASIPSFQTKCADCGHEFRNIKASSSVQIFFEMLNELENNSEEDTNNPLKAMASTYSKMFLDGGVWGGGKSGRQKRELIKNFPVPNTKEDILEFLSLAVPRSQKKGNIFSSYFSDAAWEIKAHNLLVPIWHTKCEQIIMKARFSMKEDKKSLEEVERYAKQLGIR